MSEHAEDWFRSDVRRQLVDEVEPLLERAKKVDTVTGLEFWFMPPAGQKHPKPYKQFLLALSVIYPLTLIVPWALRPLLERVPVLQYRLIAHLIVAVACCAALGAHLDRIRSHVCTARRQARTGPAALCPSVATDELAS